MKIYKVTIEEIEKDINLEEFYVKLYDQRVETDNIKFIPNVVNAVLDSVDEYSGKSL